MAGSSRTTTALRRGSPASSVASKRGKEALGELLPSGWGWIPRFAGSTLALGELEALASALFAVLLAFFHPAVAGQITRIAEPLGETAFTLGRFAGHRSANAEHRLERAGDALADRAGLTGESTPVNRHGDVELRGHFGELQRADDRFAVFFFREVAV